jgi:hypothetical protein
MNNIKTDMAVTRGSSKSGCQANSPKTKRLKKISERALQQQAFNDLLTLRNANSGRLKYGDLERVAKEYQSKGFECVTRRNLRYRMSLLEEKGSVELVTEMKRPTGQLFVGNECGLSSLSGSMDNMTDWVDELVDDSLDDAVDELLEGDGTSKGTQVKKRGRPKKEVKSEYLLAIQKAKTEIAMAYKEQRDKATAAATIVPAGTLKHLIQQTLEQYGLNNICIKPHTILSRLKRDNLSGIAHHKVSPLEVTWKR